jgi:tRNA(fMet)-specific endonuclease VapC
VVAATFVLDTDLFSDYRRGVQPLTGRVTSAATGTVFLSVITVEESLTGWYTLVRQAKRPDETEFAYGRLAQTVLSLAEFPILNYTRAAMARFDALQKLKLGVGKKDLRIAAIALERGAAVVTRNVRDFGRVPNLAVEDWSAPPSPAP